MEKNSKTLVTEYSQRQRLAKPEYVCTRSPDRRGYFCTLTLDGKSFTTVSLMKSRKAAESKAARLACDELSLVHINAEVEETKLSQKKPGKTAVVKNPGWITIKKIEDIYKSLNEEDLAQHFISILRCKAQYGKKPFPVINVSDADGVKGFIGTVTYDGVKYKSLGVMLTKEQAKQSAAEVCLRTLGDFPNVGNDAYTIQVYKGGHIPLPPKEKGGYIPFSNMTKHSQGKFNSKLLRILLVSLNLQYPSYRYKESMEGADRKYAAIVVFEGKFFEARITSDNMSDSREHAAGEALKYLGLRELVEADRIRDHMLIRGQPYFRMPPIIQSPLSFCPSKITCWVFSYLDPIDEISGEKITHKDDTLNIIEFRNLESQTSEEMFAQVMDAEPCLGEQKLSNIMDLCVGEINKKNTSTMIVGNNECSFPIFCEDGKIMCNKRKCRVDVLPGHNIRGLKCTYELIYPSLRVYLKSVMCDDLVSPETPSPVVSACGVVVLMHDHEANSEDVHILLTRQLHRKTFVTKVRYFASYLNRQLVNSQKKIKNKHTFNVADCLEDIASWTLKEVQLMSEMTLDSMHELITLHIRYDERWNEIFAKEHTDVLKELKTAAEAELVRRTEEGIEEEYNEPWSLPSTFFQHRLLASGVFIENSPLCAMRSIFRMTGLKIRCSDIEDSPVIDLPMKDDANVHRGNIYRCYIWKGLRKVSGNEEEPYYKVSSALEKVDAAYRDDDLKKNKHYLKRKRKFVGTGNKTARLEKVNGNAPNPIRGGEMPGELASEPMEDKETPSGNVTEPMEEDGKPVVGRDLPPPEHVTSMHTECRWFPLEEAKSICVTLMELSENPIFQEQVKTLQLEATEFKNAKAEANSVK